MDVSIVLTHRCNLDCGYCYAGEHHRTDVDEETLRRSVELLFSDDAETVQLSFFGGEPFLAFESMRWATELAERRAAEEGRRLLLQCTTNGSVINGAHVLFAAEHDFLVAVSIDGIEEAHNINRPRRGGGSSFGQVLAGLRVLIAGGVRTDAMMVITPSTSIYAYLSVNYLWSQGVRRVRANVAVDDLWAKEDRHQLRDQLESVGYELLARRLNGASVEFEPFERAIARGQGGQKSGVQTSVSGGRGRVVVATGGNLYPCAPMVGDDRDESPNAALRIGHLDDGAKKIAARVALDGVGCGKGGGCECAAYLETGDRRVSGPMGRYYASICAEVGTMVGETLALQPTVSEVASKGQRRAFLLGIGAIVGGAALAAPLFATVFAEGGIVGRPAPKYATPCSLDDAQDVDGRFNVSDLDDLPLPEQEPEDEPVQAPIGEEYYQTSGDMYYEPPPSEGPESGAIGDSDPDS